MKKITRILIVLSLLAILASVITIQAFAATTTIDKVYVTLDELKIGKVLPNPTTAADADYYVSYKNWSINGIYGWSDIVQDGARYTLSFTVKTKENKTFDENTVLYLNGVETKCSINRTGENEYSLSASYVRSFKTVVEMVNLTYDEFPAVGSKTVDYVVLGGNDEQYTIERTIRPSETTSTFEEHIYYDVEVAIKLTLHCEFSKNTVLVINGVERPATFQQNADRYTWRYQIVYGDPIDEIDFPQWYTDIQPGHSSAPATVPVAEDANYTVTAKWTGWSGGVPNNLVDGGVYYLQYEATPNPGYYFADDAVITMEGNPVADIRTQKRQLVSIRIEYGLNVEYLDHIDITYVRPRVGDAQSTFKASCEKATLRAPEIYRNSYYVRTDTTFLEGQTYYLTATLVTNRPCAFADTVTITFNGENPVEVTTTDRYEIELRHDIEYARGVEKVEFPAFPEMVTPGPGGITDMTAPEGATYTLKQAWIDIRTGQVVENVEAGDVYTLAYMAEPKPGYVFDENTKATLGGENCEVFAEDQYMVVYRSYDLGAQKLDRVDITLPQLYKGCTPGAATVPQGANYTLMELIWAESTTESFDDSQPVEAVNYNTNIFAVPVLCAGKGYTFTEDTKLFFNGVEVPVVFRYAEGPIMELAGLYGTLTPPTTDGWCQEDNTWVYYVDGQKLVSQWYKDSKDWVYLGADGKMLKNTWQRDSKGWCYLGEKGYMLRSSWLNDGGKWYYLNSSGYMLSSTWYKDSKDWVYLGKDGAMLTNTWQKDSKGWCYLGASGYMVRNAWVADSVGYCRLDGSGYMVKNKWVHDGYGWAYLDARGYAVIGDWVNYQGQWFAMDADGYMLSNCWITYKDDVYRLAADGHMLTDQWVDDGKGWSYVDKDGKVPFGSFVRDSKGICYITSGGYIAKGQWIQKDGKQYYADSTGHLLRNTTQELRAPNSLFTYTYKFDSNGVTTIVNPW